MMNKRELELYIHIPFCARKCAYCDFLSFAVPESTYRDYMDKLIEEIYGQSLCFPDSCVISIFLGGGTPSLLPADLIGELFAVLYGCFTIAEDAEITIEANPGTLTMEKLEVYRESGINRLSLGLQSADDMELKMLGRIHTFDDFLKSYQRARQVGFDNISVDLMSALPGQDLHSWKNTLRKVMMLKPEHISAYSLIIEEGTPFFERYGKGGHVDELPSEEEERRMYWRTAKLLKDYGYCRYEISNYALPGYECRHNLGYWNRTEYLGIGTGAASLMDNRRWNYGEEPVGLSVREQMEEFMFLGLRKMEGVSKAKFEESFGRGMEEVYGKVLGKMYTMGLMEGEGEFVRLTERGIDVSNGVMCEFLL